MRKFISVAEAAKCLGITERAVRYRLERGEIEGERRGRNWLVAVTNPEQKYLPGTPDTEKVNKNKQLPPPEKPALNKNDQNQL